MKTTFFDLARTGLTFGAALLTSAWLGAAAQDLGAAQNPTTPQTPIAPSRPEARNAAKEKIDAARDTKQGAREEIRDAPEGARDTGRDNRQTTRNAREGARDGARDARVEKRDAVNDAREGSRETARDGRQTASNAREDARDTVGDERGAIRDARRDIRNARREFIASRIRSGDLGLWFRRLADGVAVSDVNRSGAISQSGLKEGDEIVSVNGHPISSEREFVDQLFADHQNNKPAQIVFRRGGQEQMLSIQTKPFIDEHQSSDDRLHDFGLILDQNDPNHVKVQAVLPQSPAFYAGVRSGDVITGFSGQRITQLADFIKSLATANNTAQLDVNRNNQSRQLEIEVPDPFHNQPRTALRPNYQDPNANRQQLQPQPAPNANPRVPANTQPRLNNPPRQ